MVLIQRESDCYTWEQLTCNFTTGHVIELSLNNIRSNTFRGFAFQSYQNLVLQRFLVMAFQELKFGSSTMQSVVGLET